MNFETIQCAISDNIAILTISRPHVLNALSSLVLNELDLVIESLKENREARVIIITGSGEKAFVAGADIAEMAKKSKAEALEFSRKGQSIFAKLEALTQPIIAAVNGYALGGGCELALACDIRVASANAKFGQPEVSLGIMPGYAATQRLPRLVGLGNALLLMMAGDAISAEEALRIGLVQKMVPLPDLMKCCIDLAKKVLSKGPRAVSEVKRITRAGLLTDFESGSRLEAEAFSSLFGEAEMREGMQAFLEKRPPKF